MEGKFQPDLLINESAVRLILNDRKRIKTYGLRQFCRQFGVDYAKQSYGIWMLEFLYTGLSEVHGLGPELFEVAGAAFILRETRQGVWDESGNCFLWEMIIAHPLKRLTFEQNMILAEVLFVHCSAAAQADFAELPDKRLGFVQDQSQQYSITALAALLQLVCVLLELDPKSIRILKPKALRLSLQVKKPLNQSNPLWVSIPLWQKLFDRVAIEWEYAAYEPQGEVVSPVYFDKNSGLSVKKSESAAKAPSPLFRSYFREYVNGQIMKLREITDGGDGTEEECIHDTRVVFRAMLSLTDSFAPYLDNKWTAAARKKIKPAFRRLGDVRDADVVLLHLKEYADANPAEARETASLAAYIDAVRGEARSAALAYIKSPPYLSILEEMSGDIRSLACLPVIDEKYNVLPFRLNEIMPVRVREASLSLFAYDEWLHGCYVPEDMLHRMRVSFKRLRYLLEFFSGPFEKDVRKAIQICKQSQELLGAMQDIRKAAEFAARYLDAPLNHERDISVSRSVRAYIAWCDRETLTQAGRFLDYWSDAGRRELRAQIRSLIIQC